MLLTPPLRARGSRRAGLSLTLAALVTSVACGKSDPQLSDDKDFATEPGDDERDGGTNARDAARTDAKTPDKKPDSSTPKPVKPDDGVDQCAAIRQDAPPATGGVDVIFLIDTSGSMLHAITQVQANMATFVQNFEGTAADTRVVVITGDDPARGSPVAGDTERYRFIRSGVDSKALFTVALTQFNAYKDFLRPGAATQFVMITDDNDIIPPPTFESEMEKLLGHSFTQHAIASENVNGQPCISETQKANPLCSIGFTIPAVCGAASIGDAYYKLADSTGGEKLSICKADWTDVFDRLRSAVIEAVPLPCAYPLSQASSAEFDPQKVQVVYTPADGANAGEDQEFPKATSIDQCGSKVGWYYDNEANPTSIQLCPAACDAVAAGGSMDVAFGCEPRVFI
jgi:hypothetical protein